MEDTMRTKISSVSILVGDIKTGVYYALICENFKLYKDSIQSLLPWFFCS